MSTGGEVTTRTASACASSCRIQDAPALLGRAEEGRELGDSSDDASVDSALGPLDEAPREHGLRSSNDVAPAERQEPDAVASTRPTLKVIEPDPRASVVLVGSGFAMEDALVEALERLGGRLQWVPPNDIVEAVAVHSPDLVVLAGDASEDAGKRMLEALRHSPIGSSSPVAVLSDEPSLDQRLEACSHGATALIPQLASADETAKQIFALAMEMARHTPSTAAGTETTLSDLLRVLASRVRLALISPESAAADESVLLSMHSEQDVAWLLEHFVARLRKHVSHTKNIAYELDSGAAGAEILGLPHAEAPSVEDIGGVRVIVADDQPARADAVAQELRAHGATVVVSDLAPEAERFEQLRQLDPVAVVMGRVHAECEGLEFLRRTRVDLRLRWAAIRIVDWDELAPGGDGLERLMGMLAADAAPELRVREQARYEPRFDVRLESLGPARMLKALAELPFATRLTLDNRRLHLQADVARALLVGATGVAYENENTTELEGPAALAAFLVVSSGCVHVERVAQPAVVNVMSPVALALDLAEAEAVPIVPSRVLSFGDGSAPDAAELAELSVTVELPDESSSAQPLVTTPEAPALGGTRRWRRPNVAALLVCVLVAVFIVIDSSRMQSTARGAPAASSGARAVQTPAQPGLVERAERGDSDALAEIAARPASERSVEELLALSRGRVVQKQQALARVGAEIAIRPELGLNAESLRRLRQDAADPELYAAALRAIAALPGPMAGDLLYEVWVRTPERTPATELAERLVYTTHVRDRASAALSVALELRKVDKCEALRPLLVRVGEVGDQRSFQILARLSERGGTCPRGSEDCYACLRGAPELRRAIAASGVRAAPRFD